MIGGENRVRIMFNDDDGIAEVPQFLQGIDQFPVIALVETDTRLIEYVQDTGQSRADLGCQPYALGLSPR